MKIVATKKDWRKWDDSKPEIGELIIAKEKYFDPGYVIGKYIGKGPHNAISYWKPFKDFAPKA